MYNLKFSDDGTIVGSTDNIERALYIAFGSGDEKLARILASGKNLLMKRVRCTTKSSPLDPVIVHYRDDRRKTPLHTAAMYGHVSNIHLLLEQGADIDAIDIFGESALHSAAYNGNDKVIRFLLDHGTNMEKRNNSGETVLNVAISYRHEAVVQLLLDTGANVENSDNFGNTPLIKAVEMGSEGIVRLLLKNNANIESYNKQGKTPIITAIEYGYGNIARALLDGAVGDIYKHNGRYKELIDAARNNWKTSTVEVLQNYSEGKRKSVWSISSLHR